MNNKINVQVFTDEDLAVFDAMFDELDDEEE